MIHEKLLADINEYITQCEEGIRMEGEQGYKALRAVVELHKPKGNFADTYVNGEPNSPYCPECIDPDVYPCPTIQAIEKELA